MTKENRNRLLQQDRKKSKDTDTAMDRTGHKFSSNSNE